MNLMRPIRRLFGSQPEMPFVIPGRSDADVRSAFLDRMARLENFVWLLNRMPAAVPPPLRLSPAIPSPDDQSLVKRVMAAYRRAVGSFIPAGGLWEGRALDLKKRIHDALAGDDTLSAAAVLRDPAASDFFWGFDAISSSPFGDPEPHELVVRRLNSQADWRELYALWLCDALISLSEAVGARRADYPEIDVDQTLAGRGKVFDVDGIIDEIEQEIGVQLDFPNPFPNELGLRCKRGIIGFRAIQSAYQGWRIAQLASHKPDFSVLEIGAGLGRTAYFARLFGVRNYTIVDIPLTNAAQGYFLGRTLGEHNVRLGGEQGNQSLRVVPGTDLQALDQTYDLVVNVDSWTEMPKDIALSYWNIARKTAPLVLSINHEFNPHTVRDLYKSGTGARVTRFAYPMRRGYIEEIISFAD